MKEIDNTEQLEEFLTMSEQPVLVLYHADWCKPCQHFKPQFKFSAHFNRSVVHVSSNIEKIDETHTEKFNLMSVPTVILWKNGRPLKTVSGRTPHSIAVEIIDYV